MCMSALDRPALDRPTLDRRVQLLIDPEQYAQIEVEAARDGKSVAAVIREAITARLAKTGQRRAAAAQRLLNSADPVTASALDWTTEKAAIEAATDRLS